MNHIDLKYINFIGTTLKSFRKKREGLYNCDCPICGEGRARGYIYFKKGEWFFRCHNETNCSTNLSGLIKIVNPSLHKDYVLERFKGGTREVESIEDLIEPKKVKPREINKLQAISDLP